MFFSKKSLGQQLSPTQWVSPGRQLIDKLNRIKFCAGGDGWICSDDSLIPDKDRPTFFEMYQHEYKGIIENPQEFVTLCKQHLGVSPEFISDSGIIRFYIHDWSALIVNGFLFKGHERLETQAFQYDEQREAHEEFLQELRTGVKAKKSEISSKATTKTAFGVSPVSWVRRKIEERHSGRKPTEKK